MAAFALIISLVTESYKSVKWTMILICPNFLLAMYYRIHLVIIGVKRWSSYQWYWRLILSFSSLVGPVIILAMCVYNLFEILFTAPVQTVCDDNQKVFGMADLQFFLRNFQDLYEFYLLSHATHIYF